MTLVSALVPTYGRANHVRGAIETVLGQTHEEIEVVVVDDGSTDGTREVLREYEDDDRVRAFHNDRNRGIAYSFNRAADNARGTYFCILGDDDRWHPRKVEKQLALMDRLDEGYAVVYTWGVLERNGTVMNTYTPDWRGDIYPEILGTFELAPHSGHLIRRSCFEAVGGFDTDFDRAVDWEMNIRLAKEFDFEYLPEFLTEHHHHGENIPKADYTTAYDKLAAKYREERRQYPAAERAFRARRHRIDGWAALIDGHRSAGIRHYCAAFRQDPSFFRGGLVALSVFGPRAFGLAKTVRGAFARARHAGETVPDPATGNGTPTATSGTDGGRRT